MTALLSEKGLASPAVEEFYAALYDEVANKTDDVHTLPKNAIGMSIIFIILVLFNLKFCEWIIQPSFLSLVKHSYINMHPLSS